MLQVYKGIYILIELSKTNIQKQNMARVKSALLNDNMDAATASPEANRQSDHLLLAVSYNKWSKILREVMEFGCFSLKECSYYYVSYSIPLLWELLQ